MSKCKDSDLGQLLHAYELNALSQEDSERFETHLLGCEHCFSQLKSFEQEAALLTSDDEVKQLIGEAAAEESPQEESLLKKFWRYLWPETPVVFKPAMAYLLILLMILPAYHGLRKLTKDQIRPVQIISLFPDRSIPEDVFKISAGGDGLLSFVFRGAVAGEDYHLLIESQDGRVVFQDDAFSSFDQYGTGRLLLPLSKMRPGEYRLVIIEPDVETPFNRQEYSFRIEK
jgi:hypothetical protein